MNRSATTQSTKRVPAASERARLKDGVHIELSPRRVRAYFDHQVLADSQRVLLVYETKRPPLYWFPMEDVRMDRLAAKESPGGGAHEKVYWHSNTAGREADKVAWGYADPDGDLAPLEDHVALYWNAMDAWFEEDEEVFVHPRDPYTRVDTVHSSRNVRIEVDGQVIADTNRPVLLYETGLPTRYYIPKIDVRMDLLRPSTLTTACPYKGTAGYYSVAVPESDVVENIAWYYRTPIPQVPTIENMVCFFNEKVDILVDGVLQERPHTSWS